MSLAELLVEQSASIAELEARIRSDWELLQSLAQEDIELVCLRAVIGHDSNIQSAFDGLKKGAEFRLKHTSWTAPSITDPQDQTQYKHEELLSQFIPQLSLVSQSNIGNYVSYRLLGAIRVNDFVRDVSYEVHEEYLVLRMVQQIRFLNAESRKQDKLLRLDLVTDLEGVGRDIARFAGHYKQTTLIGQVLCPEVLGRAIVINSPWYFDLIWEIVKPMLEDAIIAKVQVLSSATQQEFLLQEFGDGLPSNYGGKGPQIVILDPFNGLTQLCIASAEKEIIQVEVEQGNTVQWQVKLEEKDVKVAVSFAGQVLMEPTKIHDPISGIHTVLAKGILKLVFDNSYSFLTSKTVYFGVIVTPFLD